MYDEQFRWPYNRVQAIVEQEIQDKKKFGVLQDFLGVEVDMKGGEITLTPQKCVV